MGNIEETLTCGPKSVYITTILNTIKTYHYEEICL